MSRRLELHAILVDILGSNQVYFQPPSSIRMSYPAIVYSRSDKDEKFANDQLYIGKKKYLVTVIDKDPDSSIPDEIAKLPLTSFDNFFVADNLNHDVFSIYY